MKICEKKSNTGSSFYLVLPQDQLRVADMSKGDDVVVLANEKKKELVIKKIK